MPALRTLQEECAEEQHERHMQGKSCLCQVFWTLLKSVSSLAESENGKMFIKLRLDRAALYGIASCPLRIDVLAFTNFSSNRVLHVKSTKSKS